MANASSKRIASSNESALKNIQLGLLGVNLLAPLLRFLFSLVASRTFIPSKKIIALHLLSIAGTVFVWRWFVLIGTPKRDASGLKSGEDLSGGGVVELAWDLVYMTWICTLGSAILGDWVWWFYLLIPAFGAYKAFNLVRPLLGMFLPGIFGPKIPRDPNAPAQDAADEKVESRKQAKLRARMEKGDKRVQQVQTSRR
ncbi:hypothetical protein BCR39DRAFT_530451 [Naematelia encephala]|uniref:Opsin n=1 Tax=Naematelia encephala TaxID=71784 RepID=A0A1Y2B7A8_9TREE|nr:hypothetical protein BCR39DRAFT_530451 [Naematelia encephala]